MDKKSNKASNKKSMEPIVKKPNTKKPKKNKKGK